MSLSSEANDEMQPARKQDEVSRDLQESSTHSLFVSQLTIRNQAGCYDHSGYVES